MADERAPMGRPLRGGTAVRKVGWLLGFLTMNPDLCPFWRPSDSGRSGGADDGR